MKTPLVSILFFFVAAALGAFGQFLYKSGAERASVVAGSPSDGLVFGGPMG